MTVDIPTFMEKPIEYIKINKEDYFNIINKLEEIRRVAWYNGYYIGVVLGAVIATIGYSIVIHYLK